MIRAGQRVWIKPEWQDPGDDRFQWFAIEDACGDRVRIRPEGTGLPLPPIYKVQTFMLLFEAPAGPMAYIAIEPLFELTDAARAYLNAANSGSERAQRA